MPLDLHALACMLFGFDRGPRPRARTGPMIRLLLMTLALLVIGCGKEKRQYSLAELLERLKDAKPETRYRAARELGHRRAEAKEVVPVLTQALKDEDKRVRMGGAYALAEIG